ncbi:MAG: Dam family site-specific DNA-(adenine-N6)-methyltransferase [Gloeomargarita sp. SKYBB_i_bin120]|nr:Dam family site-specific DNA-(adenine-N6)-methyltransferase [Gloeomargarita sp. SKYG98]MCS7292729.1 Dam family site-specific DNA-(adenine-N6)-methyltransferase [Gloeomargarita sp. SKYB120]MDW8178292.1 Dam family site-specific DNA-(adenine-N6)-methyltransferase [Gloeomargarita sp. SKYBB_i_bin120]
MQISFLSALLPEVVELPPPLKWAGGKRWLVPTLKSLWQPYSSFRLVEPFVGGLAIALGLRPQRALLNDINPHLINFYRQLQNGLVIDLPMENNAACYYRHRQKFNELIANHQANTPLAAALFYYLNRTGYNGLCRFNRQGQFNVPFGRYRVIHYRSNFLEYQPLLQRWEFRCGDFGDLELEPTDFIYADPPYDVEFTSYSQEDFGWKDQVRLAHWLAQHPGPVVASNQATDRIIRLYRDLGFYVQVVEAPRMIACNGDRSPAREILAMKLARE